MRYDYKDFELLEPIYAYSGIEKRLVITTEKKELPPAFILKNLKAVHNFILCFFDYKRYYEIMINLIKFDKTKENLRTFKRFKKIFNDLFEAEKAIHDFRLYEKHEE